MGLDSVLPALSVRWRLPRNQRLAGTVAGAGAGAVAAGAVARCRCGGLAVGMVLILPWALVGARWIRRGCGGIGSHWRWCT